MLTAGPAPPGTLAAWLVAFTAPPASMQLTRSPERVRLRAPPSNAPPNLIPEQMPPRHLAGLPSWAPLLRCGILFRMSMSPTRLRECIALPGWSLRELARRRGLDDGTVRQMGSGKRPVPDDLATWLERVAAAWAPLSEELREGARAIGCDRGKHTRHPRGFRPISDEEAVQLERLAAFHREDGAS